MSRPHGATSSHFPEEDTALSWRERNVRQDETFQAAMMRAIENGHEHPPIGVMKDDSPFMGRTMHGVPLFSCIGSPARLCAENGDKNSHDTSYAR